MSNQLYIMNEESADTTFRTERGASNIDLTVVTEQLFRMVTQWKIRDQESSSGHIIKYIIGQDNPSRENINTQNEVRYSNKKENHPIFRNKLTQLAKGMLSRPHNADTPEDLDTTLSIKIVKAADIETSIEKSHDIIKKACDSAYKTQYTSKKTTAHKSVPWWTDELTTLRKRTNAFRRRYQ